MRFHFPVIIIDEDFRSENATGLGIRVLAKAIEKEGMEVLGVTSYGDLTSFAQQQSRASAFILSIDDEEFQLGRSGADDRRAALLRQGNPLPQREYPDFPVWRNAHLAPHPERRAARTARLHSHVRGHAGVHRPLRRARGQDLSAQRAAALLPCADALRGGRFVFLALPGPLGRRGLPEKPGRPDVPPVFRREHAARRRLQRGRGTRPVARSHRPGGRRRSAMRHAFSTPTICISSPTAPRPRTRSSGIRRWRPATSWWSIATATSRSCTRSS